MRACDLNRLRRAWMLIGLLILSVISPVVVFAREMSCGPEPAVACDMACCQASAVAKEPACPMCTIEPATVSIQPDLALPGVVIDLVIPAVIFGIVPIPVEHAGPVRAAFAPLAKPDHGPPPDLGRAPPVRG